jgi:hypothetical protein
MRHLVLEILREKNISQTTVSTDQLYQVGLEAVKNGIEFYYDKAYSCESVIKELFIRGVTDHLQLKKTI